MNAFSLDGDVHLVHPPSISADDSYADMRGGRTTQRVPPFNFASTRRVPSSVALYVHFYLLVCCLMSLYLDLQILIATTLFSKYFEQNSNRLFCNVTKGESF